MFSKLVIISLIVSTANAATWAAYLPEKPRDLAHKEGCYVKEINDVVPFGTVVNPLGYCYRIICEKRMLNYASCGVNINEASLEPGCRITETDLTKPHPECCPRLECN